MAERKEMKWVSHFSFRFLLVTTAEPDHTHKIESWLVADGKKKKKQAVVSKTQWRHKKVSGTIKLQIQTGGSFGDSSSNSGPSHLTCPYFLPLPSLLPKLPS